MVDSPFVRKLKQQAQMLSDEWLGPDRAEAMLSAAKEALVEGTAQLKKSGQRLADDWAPVSREEFESLRGKVDKLTDLVQTLISKLPQNDAPMPQTAQSSDMHPASP